MTINHNLVFLPGWGFNASVFEAMSPHLPHKHLHYHNLPILANSSDWANLSTFALSMPEHATLVGWSLGGLIAINLCAQFPQRFNKLILLASSPKFVAEANWPGISTKDAHTFTLSAEQNIAQCMRDFHRLVCYPATSRTARNHFANHAIKEPRHTSTLLHLQYLFKTDLRTALNTLKQPILSIAGEHDAILPSDPKNNLIISDAGHGFFYTHKLETCQHINNFLE